MFYEKLERSFELFVPVFRIPARPMTHPWYTRELLSLENCNLSIPLAREIVNFMKDYAPSILPTWMASKTVYEAIFLFY
jgi:hypothetical protein